MCALSLPLRDLLGKPYNPLMSEQYNSRTTISVEGDGKASAKIKAALAKVEDDLSVVERDKDDRRTRDSYKDKHKEKAFMAMRDVAANLSLHARVAERAMWLFAMFRDDRDKVQRDTLVWAACLVAAHRESAKLLLAAETEDDGGGAGVDPAALAERERVFKEAQVRRVREVEARNEERKRQRAATASAEAATERVPVCKWDAAQVSHWVRGVVRGWTAAEVASGWGVASSLEAAAALLVQVQTQSFVDGLVAALQQPGRALGQSLAIATATKLAACCQGHAAVAGKLFEALKVRQRLRARRRLFLFFCCWWEWADFADYDACASTASTSPFSFFFFFLSVAFIPNTPLVVSRTKSGETKKFKILPNSSWRKRVETEHFRAELSSCAMLTAMRRRCG